MKQDIEDCIRKCEVCQNKSAQRKTKQPLQITDVLEFVWQNCSMDVVGPLMQTCENKILTFQDEMSKYTLAIPIPQQDASTFARIFVEQIVWNLEYHKPY